jgi:DNA-binding MarR family transcriptional regulator
MNNLPMPSKPKSFYSAETYRRDESLGWLVKRVMVAIGQQGDRYLAPLGMTHAQWSPLLRLRLCGETPVATLAAELNLDAGALTRLLDRLEAKGLVKRERCSHDRRVVMVSLSDEGQAATANAPQALAEIYNQLLAGFTEAEWRSLIDMLQRILVNAEALRAAPLSSVAGSDAAPTGSRSTRTRKAK